MPMLLTLQKAKHAATSALIAIAPGAVRRRGSAGIRTTAQAARSSRPPARSATTCS